MKSVLVLFILGLSYCSCGQQEGDIYLYYPSGALYSIERIGNDPDVPRFSYFYENGNLLKEVYANHSSLFSKVENGLIIRREIRTKGSGNSPVIYDYANGEIHSKTSKKWSKDGKKRIPYIISTGAFQGDTLMNGIINFYSSHGKQVLAREVIDGEAAPYFLLNGKPCNQMDSLGRKQGKWILFGQRYQGNCTNTTMDDFNCIYIAHIENYRDDQKIDTTFSYYQSGQLASTGIYNSEHKCREIKRFHENGRIKESYTYENTTILDSMIITVRHYDNDYLNQISKKTIGRRSTMPHAVLFSFEYKEGKPHSKTSKQFISEFTIEEEKITRTEYISMPVQGGSQGHEIEVTEILEFPVEHKTPIPYTVEIGEFDESEINLINGTIHYYNEKHLLIESKQVKDGRIYD